MADSASDFGTDAHPNTDLEELDLGSPGRKLWFMDRSMGQPALLFPLSVHSSLIGPFQPSSLANGSVHEPTVYHDADTGKFWVIFSFAIDLAARDVTRPCDLFAIDISQIVANPSFSPDQLPVTRLTNATVGLANQAQVVQALYDRSFNPQLMPQQSYNNGLSWQGVGGVNLHFETNTGACVVDEEQGPVLYWASNRRRTDGEGMVAGDLKVNTSGLLELVNRREIQHFNTTSVISFFESPRGAAGSYRSSTENKGQWSIFEFRSDDAQWQTMSGYANQINISDHNGTTIAIGDNPQDSLLVVSRYYLGNNESFGTVIVLPYADVGLNDDNGFTAINQRGFFANHNRSLFPNMFLPTSGNSEIEDLASLSGKFAHPAGGRRSDSAATAELFLTYSPTTSHGGGTYDAKLVAITNLSAPITPVGNTYLPASPPTGYPVQLVLANDQMHVFAMKPVLTHKQRFGWKHRQVMPRLAKANFAGMPSGLAGMPVAQVVAGPIYDTDVKPMARRRVTYSGSDFYDPTVEDYNNSGTHRIFARVACLTKDLAGVAQSDVWGMRIMLTDAKVRRLLPPFPDYQPWRLMFPLNITNPPLWGYLHHSLTGDGDFGGPEHFERYRHLSDVPMDNNGNVNFVLPANVPVKFFLLHQDGTVLAAHRNHHSFATGQLENRCTGCHEHVSPTAGPPQSFASPFDTLTQTGKWERQANGTMAFNVSQTPSLPVPEFTTDILPLLVSECSSCHDSSLPPGPVPGTGKFDLNMNRTITWTSPLPGGSQTLDQPVAIWAWLNKKRYVNRRVGAAMSPLAWHFFGVDSDTSPRLDGETNQRYKGPLALPGSRHWITTNVGGVNPHSATGTYRVSDRSKVQKVIEWIDAGAAIDHNAVWNGQPDARRGVNGDGYQIALSASLQSFYSGNLVVGYWDAFANITTVKVSARGIALNPHTPNGNGTHVFDLTPALPLTKHDNIVVEAIDAAGNRSVIEKTVRQLLLESETHRGEARLTPEPTIYAPGDTLKFTVDAPAHAGQFYLVAMSEGIQPGYEAAGLNLDLYLLPNLDTWLVNSILAGVQGPLDSDGLGIYTMPTTGGMPPVELYCTAIVLTGGGLAAKSNIEAIQIK